MKKTFSLLTLLLLLCTSAWADNVAITAFKASGSSPYTYECISDNYAVNEVEIVTSDVVNNPVGSNQLKVPASGTLTVSAHGKSVTQIVIVWKNTPSVTVTTGNITTSSKTTTWTGSATSVVFTNGASANQFGSITVTYSGSFADDIGNSVTLSDLTRGLYNNSNIYTIGCTITPSAYGIYVKGKVGSDINIDKSSASGTISFRSPKALSSIVLNWTDSKGNEKTPSMTPSTGTYDASTKTWTASNTTTKEVTFANGEDSKYYLKDQNVVLSFVSSDPTLSVSPASASAFSYVYGSGPSSPQSFTVTGSNLTEDDIIVSLYSGSSYYEISDDGTTYGTSDLTVESGDVVYVRLISGLSKGNSYNGTLRFASEEASNIDIALSGSVTGQTYSVTYNLNGASGDTPTETAKEENEVFTLASAPSRDCYTFAGWLCNIDDVTYDAEAGYTMTATKTTFTAQWTPVYSSSLDFAAQTLAKINEGTDLPAIATFLSSGNMVASSLGSSSWETGSDWGESIKTGYLGYKLKNGGAKVSFLAQEGKLVTIVLGSIAASVTLSKNGVESTISAKSGDNAETVVTPFVASEDLLITLTTSSSGTVTLKKILIQDYVSAEVTSAGWATFSSTNALDFTYVSGLSAHTVTGVSANVLTLGDVTTAPDETGLLLEGSANTYNIPIITNADAVGTNKLVACTSETNLTVNADHYVLVNDGGAVFQNLSEHGATIPAGKAYLNLSGAGAPDRVRIVAEENNATSIEDIKAADEAIKFFENGCLYIKRDGIIYDVMGRIVR